MLQWLENLSRLLQIRPKVNISKLLSSLIGRLFRVSLDLGRQSHKQTNLMEGQLLGFSHIVGLDLVLVEMREGKGAGEAKRYGYSSATSYRQLADTSTSLWPWNS